MEQRTRSDSECTRDLALIRIDSNASIAMIYWESTGTYSCNGAHCVINADNGASAWFISGRKV